MYPRVSQPQGYKRTCWKLEQVTTVVSHKEHPTAGLQADLLETCLTPYVSFLAYLTQPQGYKRTCWKPISSNILTPNGWAQPQGYKRTCWKLIAAVEAPRRLEEPNRRATSGLVGNYSVKM